MIYCFLFQMFVRFVPSLKINNMKKMRLFVIGALTLLSTNLVNAQAMDQGRMCVDVYYGFGSLSKAFVEQMAEPDGDFSSFGALGARFEYMASDNVGIGLEGNYLKHTATWNVDDGVNKYDYTYSVTRFRVFPRINYHFGNSDSFDAYVGVGAGYRSIVRSFSSTDPSYVPEEIEGTVPVAMRLAFGARYFFTENIGAHVEFGLGGGNIIHFGLSARF
jgi:opacity protein-like surface antigen